MRKAHREGEDQGAPVRQPLHQGRAGGRAALTPNRRLALLLYATAGLTYALDRTTKVLAEAHLEGRPPVEVIPRVLQLRFTENPGGAFGLFGGLTWLFAIVSVVVVVVVVAASRDLPGRMPAVALGLVLAGALGNLTDRLIRGPGFSGKVVDFIDLHVWPVFNAADSAIVVGAAILLFSGFRKQTADDDGRDRPRG